MHCILLEGVVTTIKGRELKLIKYIGHTYFPLNFHRVGSDMTIDSYVVMLMIGSMRNVK